MNDYRNGDERLVHKILSQNSHSPVFYEPDGNIPPDFKIGNNIAVEVRGLNQNFFQKNQVSGLDNISIPLLDGFLEVLHTFGKQRDNYSFFVGIYYKRPIEGIHEIKKLIKQSLQNFLLLPNPTFPYVINVTNKIELTIFKTNSTNKNLFRFAGSADANQGGFVISTYIENIQYCINEKTGKILDYLQRYDKWWLFLVDHLLLDPDNDEITKIKSNVQDLGCFQKVCIIRNAEIYFTLENH